MFVIYHKSMNQRCLAAGLTATSACFRKRRSKGNVIANAPTS